MIDAKDLERIWREHDSPNFPLLEHKPQDSRCPFAQKLAQWFQESLLLLGEKPSIPQIQHKIMLLTCKRFELRSILPSSHFASTDDHICVEDVFEQAFFLLEAKIIADLEYSTLSLPQPAPQATPIDVPQPLQLAGIPIGLIQE